MKKLLEKRLTKDPSQMEVVTLAVHLLGGAERAIDTEDVALQAHRLAPGRFSWKKHPEQINLELIRVYLSDAKMKGKLVLGSGRTGWRLSQKGLKWAEQAAREIGPVDTSRSRAALRSGSVDEQRWRRERSRLVSSGAWTKWQTDYRDISASEAKEVFRIDSYARGDLREAKITRLRSLFTEDGEIAPFLDHLIKVLNSEAKP